ncbi:hypothetical protein EOA13_27135, partial [Mesorhizobium sp. M7A.F.Ca.US.011.01.1.1]
MWGGATAYEILAKKDPHPSPPHKGEGTLPPAFVDLFGMNICECTEVSANGSLPPPCGEGLGVG